MSQDLSELDLNKSVYENVSLTSIQDTYHIRMILRHLLFDAGMLEKKAFTLSGGERVRLAIGKMLLSDADILLLEEITNYLDIASIEALERALCAYPGTIIFISHDINFIKHVATSFVKIENKKLVETDIYHYN